MPPARFPGLGPFSVGAMLELAAMFSCLDDTSNPSLVQDPSPHLTAAVSTRTLWAQTLVRWDS